MYPLRYSKELKYVETLELLSTRFNIVGTALIILVDIYELILWLHFIDYML